MMYEIIQCERQRKYKLEDYFKIFVADGPWRFLKLIVARGRERGREGNMGRKGKHGSVGHTSFLGIKPKNQLCSLTRSQTHHLLVFEVTEPHRPRWSIKF